MVEIERLKDSIVFSVQGIGVKIRYSLKTGEIRVSSDYRPINKMQLAEIKKAIDAVIR